MATASTAAEASPALAEEPHEGVHENQPDGYAQQKADDQSQVRIRTSRVRSYVHDAVVFSLLAAIQVLWLATLIYGAVRLLSHSGR
jgi:hypothetical protein